MASREPGAMDACMEQYGRLVWALVQKRCINRADAEDAAQDVFLELWKYAHRYDPNVASEPTFVAMITRRRLIDRQRRDQRMPPAATLPEHCEPAVADTTATAELHDEAARARRLMSQLREEERYVLQLAIDQGLSQTEIAAHTQMPLGTVKTHARRGMARLREWLSSTATSAKGGMR